VIGFAVPVSASSQTLAPTLTITLNGTAFRSGQTMSVTAKLTPGTVAAPVDAYVIVQLPTGGYLSLQLGGGLVQGIVPIARGLVPFPYEGTLASYTFGGAEPLGTYKWYALLTRPGKFDETVSEQLTPFAVTTAGPESARATLSAALRSGDIAGAAAELAGVLIDVVGGLTPAARDTVARALDTCVVLESRSDYEVCATSDQRFRFVLVRDDLAKWRVAVW
jgi:hypothetical protein